MNVAVGVIYDAQQRILITKRSASISQGGLWEFPGGKIEANETPSAALVREVKEEVGLDVLQYDFIAQIDEHRNEHTLSLFVFLVPQFQGHATCCESQQDLRWVPPHELEQYQFPAANYKIMEWIRQTVT